jgi:hypothetical protein
MWADVRRIWFALKVTSWAGGGRFDSPFKGSPFEGLMR